MGKGNRLREERKAPAGAKNTSSRGRAAAARAAKKMKAQREKILRCILCGAAALAVVAAVIVLAVSGAKSCGREQNAVSGGDVTVERADEGAPDFFRAGEYEYNFSNSAYRVAFDESLITVNDCFDEIGFTTFAPDLNESMVSVTLGYFDAEKDDDPAEDLRDIADNLSAFGEMDGFCLSSGTVDETRMAAASFRLKDEETGLIYTNTLRKLIRGKHSVLAQMCWDETTTDEQKAAMTEVFYSADFTAQ